MNIAVSGAAGRVGKRIIALANDHPEIEISGALESPGHPALGKDAGEVAGLGTLGVSISDEVASVLYLLAIVVARRRCGRQISGLDAESLRYGLDWAQRQPWLDEATRGLFREA